MRLSGIEFLKEMQANIKDEYAQLQAQVQGGFSSRTFKLASPVGQYEGEVMRVLGQPGDILTFAESLVESPRVILSGDNIEFNSHLILVSLKLLL